MSKECAISEKDFAKSMRDILEMGERLWHASVAISSICDGSPVVTIGDSLLESYIDLLEKLMLDEDQTISWWMYEIPCDMDKVIDIDKPDGTRVEYDVSTPEKLYQFFLAENFK